MFRKKCKNCGERISDKYKYCPYCSAQLRRNQDLGMLGRDDFMPSMDEVRFPRGFNMIFNSLLKNLDKQFKELDTGRERIDLDKFQKGPKINKGGLSISISTSGDRPPEIKVRSFGDQKFKRQEEKIKRGIKKKIKKLPQKKLSIGKLPKKEPKTNIRRLGDRVIYEIELPGVKSIKNVSIIQLENSIEIKAVAKDKAYVKLIPISMPITDYDLEKGKLVLELETKS